MKVILLKSIPKIGKSEDIVEVSEGYARNALFPKKLAIPATAATLSELHRTQSVRTIEKEVQRTLLEKAIAELSGTKVSITVPANEKGNLFSKIDASDVAKILSEQYRLMIDPSCVFLPEVYLKKLGSYMVTIKKDKEPIKTFTLEILKNPS